MQPNPEKLSCLSIIVCDDVYRDEVSKKLVIVGAFNQILAPGFPCIHRKMVVLFALTNGRGQYDFSLAIEHEETGEHIVEMRGPMTIDNPLIVTDVDVALLDTSFPRSGKYWVYLKADSEIIQQRPLWVAANPRQEK